MNFETSLQQIPAPGKGCHPAMMTAANIGILQGYSPDEVQRAIRAAIPEGGRRKVADSEIKEAVDKAAKDCTPDDRTGRPRRPFTPPATPKPKVDGSKLLQAIITRSPDAMELNFWELSPVKLAPEPVNDWLTLLSELYQPEDILFIGDTYDKQVDTAANHAERMAANGCAKPYIITNPLTGQQHETGSGTLSYRCDAAVKDFRFTVVEHDALSETEQLAFWLTVIREKLLDVAVLLHSGGKSFHGWIRVNATDATDYRSKVAELWRFLEPMGFDKATRNPARLSRLAGHTRENGKVQWLHYLNPNKKGAQ